MDTVQDMFKKCSKNVQLFEQYSTAVAANTTRAMFIAITFRYI